jgi:ABC-type nitrate/sulfonate/bicarbonate transport system ATPase subunit
MGFTCDKITFRYPGSAGDVFQNLSFHVANPGFNALFGPSGIGKTSLAKIIIGELDGFAGRVDTDGMSHVLYTYNLERLPGWSTVGKHLDRITPPDRLALKDELVGSFRVQDCLGSRFTQLSLGQQNRINLIRYLVQDFNLLIMDESLANVDERTRETIILKMKDLFSSAYFFYISHNVVEVSKFCREIVVFRNAFKRPQTVTVKGQDLFSGQELQQNLLEQTMLEIMNAS